jgi:hypothetical protein
MTRLLYYLVLVGTPYQRPDAFGGCLDPQWHSKTSLGCRMHVLQVPGPEWEHGTSLGTASEIYSLKNLKLYTAVISHAAQQISFKVSPPLRLYVGYCKSILALPEGLGDLTSLVELKVHDCKGIKTLPESTRQLKCLQHLEISGCSELVRWCMLNKMELVHIKEIVCALPLNPL